MLGVSSLVLSLAFSLASNAEESRSRYQGEFTGNCYCNVSGDDCACVIVIEVK